MSENQQPELQGVAIIGMAGRFPGAGSTAQFWKNLVEGVESITFLKEEDLEADRELARDPDYVKARPILDGIEMFDAGFWGMYPTEAAETDPQQRLLLEVAWEALEDAGYDPHTYPRSIAIFAGAATSRYLKRHLESDAGFGDDPALVGNNSDYLVTKISHRLNLRGPAYTVLCACSTSLVAVCQACQTLLTYQADMALAGGSALSLPQRRGYRNIAGAMTSPDGHCRPFDARAQGTLFGGGAGLVLLKRLEDAVEDGDHIYAVIRGFGVNNDGASKIGFAAPSVEGQAAAIAMAHALAGIPPETITYHEAHGTGTPLGDPIEIAALTKAFRASTPAKNFCALGSAKANIGHLDTAAGVAGLIKTALTLKHATLPPLLHFERPNPALELENSPFYVNTKLAPWIRGEFPRRASVSSFGVGGTNSHAVLEEAPEREATVSKRDYQLLTLSAKTPTALSAAASGLAKYLRVHAELNLADVAHTLQVGRHGFQHRRSLAARSYADAIAKLEAHDARTGVAKESRPRLVFLFPGQGAQYCGMGQGLYESEVRFREVVDECAAILDSVLPRPLLEVMYPKDANDAETQQLLTSTQFAQPALFVTEYALARLWMSWGIEPQAIIGHSVGEFVAACLAGVFTLEDALKLVATRGRMVQEQPRGSMLAVRLPEKELKPLLSGQLSIAAINTPGLCVVSGPDGDVAAFEESLKAKGIVSRHLHTSHAFHSSMMDPIVGPFTAVVAGTTRRAPELPYISTVTGTWVAATDAVDAGYWATHLRQTVRFADGMATLFGEGDAVLLEVGPGNTLSNLATQHPGKAAGTVVISSLTDAARKSNDTEFLLESLGRLWSVGLEPDWGAFHQGERLHRVPLPTYPFERQRYWVDTISARQPVVENVPVPAINTAAPANSLEKLVTMFAELSGMSRENLRPGANFLELGFDSLFLTQVTREVETRFGVKVTFRQLAQTETSIEKLAAYMKGLVPDEPAQEALPAVSFPPVPANLAPISGANVEAVMQMQLNSMMELMSRQLETLRGLGLASAGLDAEAARRLELLKGSLSGPPVANVKDANVAVTEAPVTEAQMEIILASELNEEVSCAFNESVTTFLEGRLDGEAMRYAVHELTRRHDAFRMTLSWSRDYLRFTSEFEYALPFIDLSDLPETEREARLLHIQEQDARTPFDLVKGPLARFQLVKLGPARHALIFTAHHILCDGWSANVLLDELGQLYSAKAAGREPRLLPAPSFAAYAKRQSEERDSARAKQCEKYWLGEFPEFPPDLDLPGDRSRPAQRSHAGATFRTHIAADVYREVKEAGAAHGASLFVTLLAGFEVLLSRLSGQNDIVIGIPTAGQSLLPNQNLVGHCVHFLPLRSKLAPEMKFTELLAQQKQKMLDAYDHQTFTYGTLAAKLGKRPDLSRLPITEVRFNLDRLAPGVKFADLGVHCENNRKAFVNFDLVLNVSESDDGLAIECDYNTGLYDESTIARWVRHYETLLLSFVRDPQATIARLPLLDETEGKKILVDWNATDRDYPRDSSVHGLFEQQVALTAESVAAVFEDEQLRYAQLERRANQLARHLIKMGVGTGQVVGIYLDRSLEMLVALLGTLKAGAAYLPLDPSHPSDRIEFIVNEARLPVLLTQSHLAVRAPKSEARVVCLDGDWELIARESDSKPAVVVTPQDLAYVIYTSGSTGKPKGVEVPHGAVVNLLCAMADQPGMTAADTLFAVTTLAFDIAGLELFLPLIVGGKVVIASREVAGDPVQLMARLESCGASLMQATPVTWRMMLDAGWRGSPLKKMLCGGEALPRELADRLLNLGPELWNMYGPTETTIWSSTGRVEPGEGRVPIGPPIANTQFYILDASQQPQPIGVPGELCIAGDGVARGYYRRPELTGERFVPDPFHAGARMYRTGDLARYLKDGTIDFLGRLDHQVKLRGYRIELGEIEAVLAKHPQVAQAVVMVREDDPGDQRLVAYLVASGGPLPGRSQLRAFAGEKLPDYMVPSRYVQLPALPLTANGKIDRKALPKPETEIPTIHAVASSEPQASSANEKALLKIWKEVLKIDALGVNESILDLGADSIQIFQIATRAQRAGFSFAPREILKHGTVANLCRALGGEAQGAGNGRKPLRKVDRERYRVKPGAVRQ